MLLKASSAVTVKLNGVPAVVEAGAETVKCVAAAGATLMASEVPVMAPYQGIETTERMQIKGKSLNSVRLQMATVPDEATVNDGSVPETDFCFPSVPDWTIATGVSAGIPSAISDFVQSPRFSVPIKTTFVPGIFAICS